MTKNNESKNVFRNFLANALLISGTLLIGTSITEALSGETASGLMEKFNDNIPSIIEPTLKGISDLKPSIKSSLGSTLAATSVLVRTGLKRLF